MQIKNRSLPMYIFLNCITLGIYGFVESMAIEREINAICKGDGEKPRLSYMGAVLVRAIPAFLGIIIGLFAGINMAGGWMPGSYKTIMIFFSMATYGLIVGVLGSILSGIYFKYWWYKQANRLKLNAGRYGLEVREGGIDNFLFRNIFTVGLLPITVILLALSCVIPFLIIWLISLAESTGALVICSILLFIFSLPLMIFGGELSTGSYFAMYFVFKNLDRYAKVYRNGAQPYDPMGYEYYPSFENNYVKNGQSAEVKSDAVSKNNVDDGKNVEVDTVLKTSGQLIGIKGACAGYSFELASGEEVVLGKDAKMSSIVIDPAYKEISRKHVSICYDITRDQYRVTDFSSNGTWANGEKLTNGQPVYLYRGTELKLANDKNIFRLG